MSSDDKLFGLIFDLRNFADRQNDPELLAAVQHSEDTALLEAFGIPPPEAGTKLSYDILWNLADAKRQDSE